MKSPFIVFLVLVLFCLNISAQTTAFTYQGSFKDGASPANGNYDFEFKLFDLVSAGAQQGSTLERLNVAVANGIFSVSLDFGAPVLPGADRFLDIGVRTAGGGAFTLLSPRQKVNSAPYAVRSLNATAADVATNATQLGGLAANQFVVTTDPRMTDARQPTAGSAHYIQNQNAAAQSSSNFNISGDGTVGGTFSGNIVNTATQYNIGGNQVLRIGTVASETTSVGVGAGLGSFRNSMFGAKAGLVNANGCCNSFFGALAGTSNTVGTGNSIFGSLAGSNTLTGSSNSFFGQFAGQTNVSGNSNTIIGNLADVASSDLDFATAIGAGAIVTLSNTVVVGRAADTVRVPGSFNSAGLMSTNGNLVVLGTSTFAGILDLGTLGAAGSQAICRNGSGHISTCSSSLRYKTNIGGFSSGMSFVNQLRPISFDWKVGGMKDVGFGAEDIAKIDPRFVTYNEKGEVEGVKYDRLSVAFVNAFKEQQAQIEAQHKEIGELKKIVCAIKPDAEVCKQIQ